MKRYSDSPHGGDYQRNERNGERNPAPVQGSHSERLGGLCFHRSFNDFHSSPLSSRSADGGVQRSGPRDASNQYKSRAETLSIDEARQILSYDRETGIFTWKRGFRAGRTAGGPTRGYVRIKIDRIDVLAHRLAWAFEYGCWPPSRIDHIDRNPSNNAIANLREATVSQNAQNANRRGYSKQTNGGGFLARIKVKDRMIFLGTYPTEGEARSAYIEASRKHFGEFSAFCDGGHK